MTGTFTLLAQSKGENRSARKIENPKIVQPASFPAGSESAVLMPDSRSAHDYIEKNAILTGSHMPRFHVAVGQPAETRTKSGPHKSASEFFPENGKIFPREKLNNAR